ncbi:MAG: hypothetical protein MJZ85_06470 [Bacteroidales bacterium]|nr:hypothetical protein [Bacteroidales bacterium]
MSDAKHFFSKDFNYSEENLGNSIQSWLSYQIALNRNYDLAESSINTPFGEYLAQYVSELEMEKELKYFGSRWTDAFFKRRDLVDVPYYFEFKYTKSGSTRKQSEKQRVFNDLMRLNSIDDNNSRKFFLLAGKSEEFLTDFEQLISGQTVTKNKLIPTNKSSTTVYNSIYNKMFSFDMNNPYTIIDVVDPEISGLITGFDQKYANDYRNNLSVPYAQFSQDISKITTKLVFLSCIGTSARVGIWEIIKTQL